MSDRDKKVARLYDVVRRLGLGVSRVTYLIDGSGLIRGVYHHEVRIGRHVQDVLKGLEALHGDATNSRVELGDTQSNRERKC